MLVRAKMRAFSYIICADRDILAELRGLSTYRVTRLSFSCSTSCFFVTALADQSPRDRINQMELGKRANNVGVALCTLG